MRDEYDFSNGIRNPYVKPGEGKTVITIRLDTKVVDYFKTLSANLGIPYQTLINSYLADCTKREVKPEMNWVPA